MRLSPMVAALAALALGASSGLALAQCSEDARLRVQRELEITGARIERAELVVGGSDNQAAALELRTAKEIQARAVTEFSVLHCRIALDLTLRARFHASHAIDIIRGLPDGGLPDPGRVLTQLERTRDLIDRARERIEECNEERARAILRAAIEMQHRAEDAFAHERYLAAFQLTVSARERALRALRFCNIQEDLQESADRGLRRTDEILSRARDLVAEKGVERARQVLDRATELEDRARAEFRAGRFESSLRLTLSARALAQRAVQLSGSTP